VINDNSYDTRWKTIKYRNTKLRYDYRGVKFKFGGENESYFVKISCRCQLKHERRSIWGKIDSKKS
jgi:hypothetical protein